MIVDPVVKIYSREIENIRDREEFLKYIERELRIYYDLLPELTEALKEIRPEWLKLLKTILVMS